MFKMSLYCVSNMQEKRIAQKKAAKRQEIGSKAIVDVWRLPHFGKIKEGIPEIHLKLIVMEETYYIDLQQGAFDKMQMFW